MKPLTIGIYIILIISIYGCDPHDGKLTIVNNTEDTIFYSFSYESDSISSYPINQVNGKDNYKDAYLVQPGSENHEPVMDTWEYFINNRCKDSTLRVFFFSNNLIKTAGRDSILKFQLYTQRLRLRVNDLNRLNWRIVYENESISDTSDHN